jgi:hypothetical protein
VLPSNGAVSDQAPLLPQYLIKGANAQAQSNFPLFRRLRIAFLVASMAVLAPYTAAPRAVGLAKAGAVTPVLRTRIITIKKRGTASKAKTIDMRDRVPELRSISRRSLSRRDQPNRSWANE